MKRLMLFVASLASITTLVFAVSPALLADTPQNEICTGIGITNTSGNCGDSGKQASAAITTGINVFIVFVGTIAVIMLIVSGFRFITSGGDPQKVTGAKNGIVYSLIGIVVIVFARFIVQFILNKLS